MFQQQHGQHQMEQQQQLTLQAQNGIVTKIKCGQTQYLYLMNLEITTMRQIKLQLNQTKSYQKQIFWHIMYK